MTARWADHHVRGRPDLANLVNEYLHTYTGSFDYLIECKQRVLRQENLAVPLIRGVLNCMSADPAVHNMPVPESRVFDAGGRSISWADAQQHTPGPTFGEMMLEDVADMPPVQLTRKQIKLKTRWRKGYGISKRPNARLVHVIDQSSSGLTYWSDSVDPDSSRYIWELNWMCNKYMYINGRDPKFKYSDRYILLDDAEVKYLIENGHILQLGTFGAREWKLCGKCDEEMRA